MKMFIYEKKFSTNNSRNSLESRYTFEKNSDRSRIKISLYENENVSLWKIQRGKPLWKI